MSYGHPELSKLPLDKLPYMPFKVDFPYSMIHNGGCYLIRQDCITYFRKQLFYPYPVLLILSDKCR